MTIPVIHSFHAAFPQIQLSVLTKRQFAPLFKIIGVEAIIVETKNEHKGILGLLKLFRQLKKHHGTIDAIADLHNVLRSNVLRVLFKISGNKTAVINKGRNELKTLTRSTNKIMRPLPTRFEKYKEVFEQLGFAFALNFTSLFKSLPVLDAGILKYSGEKTQKWIGIAPFAAFSPKIYPLEKMKWLVRELNQDPRNKIFFFGGGPFETKALDEWEQEFGGSVSMSGKSDLQTELSLIAHLDVMVAMDSANMHFASLVNIPVISIWGATHPYAGFVAWGQKTSSQLQTDLFCRPCSVYGNVPCYRGDHACMNELPVSLIVEHLLNEIQL